MINEINAALDTYEQKWQKLIAVRHERKFFGNLMPTAIAWKVEDREEFNAKLVAMQEVASQIHIAWLNERWLATIVLRDTQLANGCSIVKLMERRPGSDDAVGLDHVDFVVKGDVDIKSILAGEADLRWNEENNGEHCKWISIWFDETEAKLRRDTVLQVCSDELTSAQTKLLDSIH